MAYGCYVFGVFECDCVAVAVVVVGIMLDWIKGGMKADYHEIVDKISTMAKGSIAHCIENLAK